MVECTNRIVPYEYPFVSTVKFLVEILWTAVL